MQLSKTQIYISALILISLIYFSPIIFTSKTIWVSEFDHYIPDLHIILEGWKNLKLPLWTDLQWGGFPHHAVLHNPTWYPPIIVLGMLRFDAFASAKILIITHFIWGMIGMFFLARKYFDEKYSFLAGLLFGFNPVMLSFVNKGWLTFVLGFSWIPLFFLIWFHDKNTLRKIFLSSLTLAMILHSGGIFILYYLILFVAFVQIFQSIFSKEYKNLLILLTVLILFFGITFFKILPGIEFSKETPRTIPISYETFLESKVSIFELPNKTIGYVIILSLLGVLIYFLRKDFFAFNLSALLFLGISTGPLFYPAFYLIPLFKMQSDNLDRVLYPLIPFLIMMLLYFVQNFNFKMQKIKYLMIFLIILSIFMSFQQLNVGDYKAEIDQNEALQYIAKDKTCCWRAWQVEEGKKDTTLNAYTTPLNIRTLFGFMGSRFYNMTYEQELIRNTKNFSYFLDKYNIKYLLSKKPIDSYNFYGEDLDIPKGFVFVKKFPNSTSFKPGFSGQYVYVRQDDQSV